VPSSGYVRGSSARGLGWGVVALEDGCPAGPSGALYAFDHGNALQSGAVGVCGPAASQRQVFEADHRSGDASALSAGLRRAENRAGPSRRDLPPRETPRLSRPEVIAHRSARRTGPVRRVAPA